jgi:hypothetical protein
MTRSVLQRAGCVLSPLFGLPLAGLALFLLLAAS